MAQHAPLFVSRATLLSPLESWERPMRWLTRELRQRMESPDFYRLLQEQISRRYLALARPAG